MYREYFGILMELRWRKFTISEKTPKTCNFGSFWHPYKNLKNKKYRGLPPFPHLNGCKPRFFLMFRAPSSILDQNWNGAPPQDFDAHKNVFPG